MSCNSLVQVMMIGRVGCLWRESKLSRHHNSLPRSSILLRSPRSSVHHTTVALPPGTHHIRFLIDNQWQVADDYPTAVDDQGSLANYVSVPITYSPPTATNMPSSVSQKLPKGQSFWSAASSADADEDGSQDTPPASATRPTHAPHHHHPHPSQSHAVWTAEIPPELEAAAREEETYVAASTGQVDATHTIVNGFIPAPNIPPAPSLPRHLEKLILNSRVVIGGAAPASSTSTLVGSGAASGARSGRGSGGREGRHASNANAAGRAKSGRDQQRERRGGDRDRESARGRERRGGNGYNSLPPPPPPPSEADVEVASVIPATIGVIPSPVSLSTPTAVSSMPSVLISESSLSAPGVLGTPAVSAPPTPTISPSTSRPLTLALDSPSEQQQTLTDDGSVLPVPSHVVLHHLSTSAIRNGVLAVADSTRYRKKYLTTVYYKPTSL